MCVCACACVSWCVKTNINAQNDPRLSPFHFKSRLGYLSLIRRNMSFWSNAELGNILIPGKLLKSCIYYIQRLADHGLSLGRGKCKAYRQESRLSPRIRYARVCALIYECLNAKVQQAKQKNSGHLGSQWVSAGLFFYCCIFANFILYYVHERTWLRGCMCVCVWIFTFAMNRFRFFYAKRISSFSRSLLPT